MRALRLFSGSFFLGLVAASVSFAQSTDRSWFDPNGNRVADCDLNNPALNGECGPWSNLNFGKSTSGTTVNPATLEGWGSRPSAPVPNHALTRYNGSASRLGCSPDAETQRGGRVAFLAPRCPPIPQAWRNHGLPDAPLGVELRICSGDPLRRRGGTGHLQTTLRGRAPLGLPFGHALPSRIRRLRLGTALGMALGRTLQRVDPRETSASIIPRGDTLKSGPPHNTVL